LLAQPLRNLGGFDFVGRTELLMSSLSLGNFGTIMHPPGAANTEIVEAPAAGTLRFGLPRR
jgi:hypothetical protein